MFQTGSATLLRYCNVLHLIPRRGSCSSMVRFHAVYAPSAFLTNCPLGLRPTVQLTSRYSCTRSSTRPLKRDRSNTLGLRLSASLAL